MRFLRPTRLATATPGSSQWTAVRLMGRRGEKLGGLDEQSCDLDSGGRREDPCAVMALIGVDEQDRIVDVIEGPAHRAGVFSIADPGNGDGWLSRRSAAAEPRAIPHR